MKLSEAARGRWFDLLTGLGGIDPAYLEDKHGPCPVCAAERGDGGEDRWRWDDRGGDGGGYCNQCGGPQQGGGSLSGLDILMRVRGWDFGTAAKEIERTLGVETTTTPRRKGKEYRQPEKPPVDAAPPGLSGAVAQWCYRNAAGEQLFWIQRVNLASGGKLFIYRTWLDGRWYRPSKKHDFTAEWPAPRPIYGLELLGGDEPVVIAEGEKAADVLREKAEGYAAVSWCNGAKAVDKTDWSPLRGRDVVICPDNDKDGEVAVSKLRVALRAVGIGSLAVCRAPEGKPEGWDVADEEEWSELDVALWLGGAEEDAPPEPPAAEKESAEPGWPFAVLGFSGDDFYYQPGDSGQVMALGAGSGHSASNLIRLAPKAWWEREFPRYNKDGEVIGVDWLDAVDTLTRRQHEVGAYDANRIRGVGAWLDDGAVVFHLGDRLIWGDRVVPVLDPPPSRYLYQRLPRKAGPGSAEPMGDEEGLGLAMLCQRFSWETSSSALLLAGWTALAPIAGALEWRPHVWVTGVAGCGKTTVVTDFALPLLGDMSMFCLGNTTEAGIRQTLRSDAIPVVFDEAEANQKHDAIRIQNILALARAASAQTGAHQYKGTANGESQMYEIRSMFMLSSITSSLKEGADRSRFSELALKVGLSGGEYEALARDVSLSCTKASGQRLVARMVRLVPLVREVAEQMRVVVARNLKGGSRLGQQLGTLLAGYWCLANQRPPTEEEALDMVRRVDWKDHGGEGDEQGGDQGKVLAMLLDAQLRVESSGATYTRTVLELCHIALKWKADGRVVVDDAVATLGRLGIKAKEGRVHFANFSEGIERILAGNKASTGGWGRMLAALPGAMRHDPQRFTGIKGQRRSVSVPLDTEKG